MATMLECVQHLAVLSNHSSSMMAFSGCSVREGRVGYHDWREEKRWKVRRPRYAQEKGFGGQGSVR